MIKLCFRMSVMFLVIGFAALAIDYKIAFYGAMTSSQIWAACWVILQELNVRETPE